MPHFAKVALQAGNVVVPGLATGALPPPATANHPEFYAWLRVAARARGRGVCGVHRGLLGAAGLLQGSTCTTHWQQLLRCLPAVVNISVYAHLPYCFYHSFSPVLGGPSSCVPNDCQHWGAFVIVLLALMLLLWVPTRALLSLVLIGLPIGWALGILEVVVFPALVQRLPLRVAIFLQGVGHLLLLLLLHGSLRLLAHHLGLPQLWPEPAVAAAEPVRRWLLLPIVYVLAVVVTSLLRQLLQGMSRQRLRELLNGRYQQPEVENRIFLFVDLKDSTQLAETLGNDQYSRLVRDFFRDVSPAIAAARGEVYQYVGDEVVVTWPSTTGLTFANCLHCFFDMQRAIAERHEVYQRAYGVVPSFKAGAHGGSVTTVLVGTQHRELVYHGDVLNTTARIQAQCNALGSRFLVSAALRQQLGEQPEFQFTALGGQTLRGKAGATELFDVQLYLPISA